MKKLLLSLAALAAVTLSARGAVEYTVAFAGSPDQVVVKNLNTNEEKTLNGTDELFLSDQIIGIADSDVSTAFKVFPNPATDEATLSFYNPQAGTVTIQVVSLQGALVAAQTSSLAQGEATYTISGLADGTYIVNVAGTAQIGASKLTIEGAGTAASPQLELVNNMVDETVASLKSAKAGTTVEMKYNAGDIIKFVGKKDASATTVEKEITADETITFEYITVTASDIPANDTIEKGDAITLTGTDFGTVAGDIKVIINGVEQTVTSVTDTEIKFDVVAKTLAGDINVYKGDKASMGAVAIDAYLPVCTYTADDSISSSEASDIELDPITGNYIIYNRTTGEVVRMDTDGKVINNFNIKDHTTDFFCWGTFMSNEGVMYLPDTYGRICYLSQGANNIDTLIGTNEDPLIERLKVIDITGDNNGNLYVTTGENKSILKIEIATKTVTTLFTHATEEIHRITYKDNELYFITNDNTIEKIDINDVSKHKILLDNSLGLVLNHKSGFLKFIDGLGLLFVNASNRLCRYKDINDFEMLFQKANLNITSFILTEDRDLLSTSRSDTYGIYYTRIDK